MKKKIYPKEWIRLHPYQIVDEVDRYYTGVANQIYQVLNIQDIQLETVVSNRFSSVLKLSIQALVRSMEYFSAYSSSSTKISSEEKTIHSNMGFLKVVEYVTDALFYILYVMVFA